MKTIIQGNAESAKEYKYFECKKCGWAGKASKDEYEYHSDQREGDWARIKCPVCHKLAYDVKDVHRLSQLQSIEQINAEGYLFFNRRNV